MDLVSENPRLDPDQDLAWLRITQQTSCKCFENHPSVPTEVPGTRCSGKGSAKKAGVRAAGKTSRLPCVSCPGSVLCLFWVKSYLAIDFAVVHSFLLELHKGLLYLYSLSLEDC